MQTDTKLTTEVGKNLELHALRNAIKSFGLTGYVVHEDLSVKKRPNRANKYLLIDDKGNSLTGWWHYPAINHFILGYGKAVNNYSKLVEENENLKRENNRLKHYYEIACDEVNKSWIPKHNKLIESNRELMAEIERLLQQWDRQKNLFPELMKDGWMELEMKNAQTILNNAKNL